MVVLECVRSVALLVVDISDRFEQLAVFWIGTQCLHVPILGLVEITLAFVDLADFHEYLRVGALHRVQLVELIESLLVQANSTIG